MIRQLAKRKGQQLAANLKGSGKTNKDTSSSSEYLPSLQANGNDANHDGQRQGWKQNNKSARRRSHEARINANEERRQEILRQKREEDERAAREEPEEIHRR